MIGFSVANYDLEFLDEALNSGAGGKFDYLSLSPFHYASGSDRQLATVLPTVRKLLTSHGLPSDMPVHITLTGEDEDLPHAAALANALGFDRVFVQFAPALLGGIPKDSPSLPEPLSYEGKNSVALTFAKPTQALASSNPTPQPPRGMKKTKPPASPSAAPHLFFKPRFSSILNSFPRMTTKSRSPSK